MSFTVGEALCGVVDVWREGLVARHGDEAGREVKGKYWCTCGLSREVSMSTKSFEDLQAWIGHHYGGCQGQTDHPFLKSRIIVFRCAQTLANSTEARDLLYEITSLEACSTSMPCVSQIVLL